MKTYCAYFILIAGTLFLSSSLTAQQTVSIDTSESTVHWIGKKPLGEHTGIVNFSSGELIVHKNEVTGGSFTIDMNSIKDMDLKDDNFRNKLQNHLKSPDFFDVKKYPVSRFVITGVTRLKSTSDAPSKTTHRIKGNLTIKGITKKISFDASINSLNNRFIVSTPKFVINRTDWGVNYQSKSVFAELKDQFIYDEITLSVELVTK